MKRRVRGEKTRKNEDKMGRREKGRGQERIEKMSEEKSRREKKRVRRR